MLKTVLVTGGSGLVGSAIRGLSKDDFDENILYNFIYLNSKMCDLKSFDETKKLFELILPNYVIHLAACVGGLYKNLNNPATMYTDNILINTNVLECARLTGVEKLVACLSTCIFPDKVDYPIHESSLHDGPPHPSNESYAYAKRMLEVQCRAYNKQYNCNFICVIPTNVYGPNDNYNLEDSHVIPALIHRCYLAKQNGLDFIVRGTGKPLRQFIYSMDLAKLIIIVLQSTIKESIILSPSNEYTIEQVSKMISSKFGMNSILDNSSSDGQYRKTSDNSKLNTLLNYNKIDFKFTDLEIGLSQTIDYFIEHYELLRK